MPETNKPLTQDDIDFITTATQLSVKLLTQQSPTTSADIRRAHQALTDAASYLAEFKAPPTVEEPLVSCIVCLENYLANHNHAEYVLCLETCT